MPINLLLKKRFSPTVFLQESVPKEHRELFFEASRWAPSSYNRQPWFYYYANHNTTGFEKLSQLLVEGNAWAKNAPLLMLGCYIESDDRGKNVYAQYDLGQAVFSLCVEAQELGYYMHQMGGFDKQKATEVLSLPPQHIPHVMIAVGKINEAKIQTGIRTRKESLTEKVE